MAMFSIFSWKQIIWFHFNREVPICLVGNKQDLCHSRQVSEEEGRSLAQENKCLFQEVSAAENYLEISNLFTKLIRHVMEQLKLRGDRRRYSGSKSMAKLINNVFGKRRKSVWVQNIKEPRKEHSISNRDVSLLSLMFLEKF